MYREDLARRQLRACSACAGDYEDPECTAEGEGGEEEDAADATTNDATRSLPRDEFPALER
jgi:hypothetical protein